MARKRSKEVEGVQTDELESPSKKVEIMDVSNQASDEENQGAQSDREAKTEHVTEKVSKKELKRKISLVTKPRRYVKKKKNDSEIARSVVSKDGASASTESASKTVEDSQKHSVPKEKDVTTAMTDSDHLLSLSEEVESLQAPKCLTLEKESAATDSHHLSSAGKEVEDLLTAMFAVPQEKDSMIASTDSDCLLNGGMEVDDSQTVIHLVPQKTDKPSNEGECDVAMKIDDSSNNEISVKCFEVPHEKEDSLGLLLMDLEDTPVDFPEQCNNIVSQVECTDDYVIIPSQSNTDPKNENDKNKITGNIVNGGMNNLENQSTDNTVTADNKKVTCNQDKVKANINNFFPSKEITNETLKEVVTKRNNKVKTQVTSPLINHSTVHIKDEILCEMCEQKINMTLEGTDIFHSNLILRNEDGTKVSIENIKTTYSVRCKNKHLCHFDFELMEKIKMVPAESSSKYTFVHIEDEISCKSCEQKIKMKLEGIDLLHSNMILLDEDANNVSIENIKTTYSLHCKNKHTCNFDFGLMEREELQLEEKIDCWEKLKMLLWNVWKKMELMVTRVLFE